MDAEQTPEEPVRGSPPVLDPVVERLLRASATPPHLPDLGPVDGRLALREAQGHHDPDDDRVPSRFVVAPIGPFGLVGFHEFRPSGLTGPVPVVLYLHGGRWMLGDAGTHARLVRELASAAGAVFLVPEYSRTPEARYPVALQECDALLKWVAGNAGAHRWDAGRVAVAGDCAGATLATALALLTSRRDGVRLRAQLLYYPMTDSRCDSPSHRRFAEGYLLTSEHARWYWEQYLGRPEDHEDPAAVPMRAGPDDLAGLPPALVVTAEADVLRDEAEHYADRMKAAGAAVTTVRYPGTVHDFVALRALERTAAARSAVIRGAEFLRAALDAAPPGP